jgi:hypothetical protein
MPTGAVSQPVLQDRDEVFLILPFVSSKEAFKTDVRGAEDMHGVIDRGSKCASISVPLVPASWMAGANFMMDRLSPPGPIHPHVPVLFVVETHERCYGFLMDKSKCCS